jgi:hypothetical protein
VSTTGGLTAGTNGADAGVLAAGISSNCLMIFCKLVRGMPSSPAISRCGFPAAKSLRNCFSSMFLAIGSHDHIKFIGVTIGVHSTIPDVDMRLPPVDNDHVLHWATSLLKKKSSANFLQKNYIHTLIWIIFYQ